MDYWQCPECGASWGIEEYDWQRCFACGWPDVDAQGFDDYDEDDYPRRDDEFEAKGGA